MPPFQKRTLYSFIFSIIAAAVLVPILAWVKPTLDLFQIALLICAPFGGAVLLAWYLTRPRPDQPVVEDERDKEIMKNVPRYQAVGVFLAAAAWMLVVAYIYNDEQVPMGAFGFLIPSMLLGNVVFMMAGVMIEYWRAKSGFVMTTNWRAGIVVALVLLVVIAFPIAHNLAPAETGEWGAEPQFTACSREVKVGVHLQFVNTSVVEREPSGWRWVFGDGSTSEDLSPSHAYSSPGRYTVELEAHFKEGWVTETKENYITVLP
jgi:hypothetical protein